MGMPNLNPDGPHDPENTEAVAALIREATRFLNYATMPGRARRGIGYPVTAYGVLGSLAAAMTLMDQFTRQLAEFLTDEAQAGRVIVQGGSHDDRPDQAVAAANAALRRARRAAAEFGKALSDAQSAITWASAPED